MDDYDRAVEDTSPSYEGPRLYQDRLRTWVAIIALALATLAATSVYSTFIDDTDDLLAREACALRRDMNIGTEVQIEIAGRSLAGQGSVADPNAYGDQWAAYFLARIAPGPTLALDESGQPVFTVACGRRPGS